MADEMEKTLATKMNMAARKNPAIMARVKARQLTGALNAGNVRKATRLSR